MEKSHVYSRLWLCIDLQLNSITHPVICPFGLRLSSFVSGVLTVLLLAERAEEAAIRKCLLALPSVSGLILSAHLLPLLLFMRSGERAQW